MVQKQNKRKGVISSIRTSVKAAQMGRKKAAEQGEATLHTGTALAKTLLLQDHTPKEVTALLHGLGVPRRHARTATLRAQAAHARKAGNPTGSEEDTLLAIRRLEEKLARFERTQDLAKRLDEISAKLDEKDGRVVRALEQMAREMGEVHRKIPERTLRDGPTMKLLKLRVLEERLKKEKSVRSRPSGKDHDPLRGYRSA